MSKLAWRKNVVEVKQEVMVLSREIHELDFSNIPLRPTSKSEIQQLETALIIGTIYSPEVLELIRDPHERATWVDSLAVAAAALAREKAGYTVSQIAEELGRSENTIRAHLHGKTKAGKLVRNTYEKLARGELKLVVPFISTEMRPEELKELLALGEKVKLLEEKVKALEEENKRLKQDLENCIRPEEVRREIEEFEKKIRTLEEEKNQLMNELKQKEEVLAKIREVLGC